MAHGIAKLEHMFGSLPSKMATNPLLANENRATAFGNFRLARPNGFRSSAVSPSVHRLIEIADE
jgi:hypothetical protein